jgi:hypothetical protein
MKEELLHYVWKTRNFDITHLFTTEDKEISISKYGHYNLNAGPDFLEGQVQVDRSQWFGHIEMHVLSSDWIKHKHETDANYQNVILHVVYEEDEIIYRQDGSRIPCIELKGRIPFHVIEGYEKLHSRVDDIACSNELHENEKDIFYFQLNRMYIERLESKSYPIAIELEANKNNWSQTLFICIAKGMGLPVNSEAMASLARSIPLALISKHRDHLFQLESIFFGQAGMLNGEWKDEYPSSLIDEYNFLKTKYQLTSMSGVEWKLSRMRPASFPTLRIAFLASLYHKHKDLHASILYEESLDQLLNLFDLSINPYWSSHFLWDKETSVSEKKLGFTAKANIVVNSIVPYLFAYGQFMGEDKYIDRAMRFMNELKPESNKIIKRWKKHNVKVKNAMDSQALIHLYKQYCLKKRCTECAFGNKILKSISMLIKEDMDSTYRALLL